jgi:hypothetical protein
VYIAGATVAQILVDDGRVGTVADEEPDGALVIRPSRVMEGRLTALQPA